MNVGIKGKKQLIMLELWDLVAVVSKTLKFINYRSRKVEHQIRLIREGTERTQITRPLWVKVNSSQTFMMVVVDLEGIFLINLVTFMYNFVVDKEFLRGREDIKNEFLNPFSNIGLKMKEAVEANALYSQVGKNKKKKIVESMIRNKKAGLLKGLFDVSGNFEYLVNTEAKDSGPNMNLMLYKRDSNSQMEIDFRNPTIHFKFNKIIKLNFKVKQVRVTGSGQILVCSQKNVLSIIGEDEQDQVEELKKMEKAASLAMAQVHDFELSRDDRRVFVTLSSKQLRILEIKDEKVNHIKCFALPLNPLCFGISSDGKKVGLGAFAGEDSVFFTLGNKSSVVPLPEILKDQEIFKWEDTEERKRENVYEELQEQIINETFPENMTKLKGNSVAYQKKQSKKQNYEKCLVKNQTEFGIPNMNRKGQRYFKFLKPNAKFLQELEVLLKEYSQNLQGFSQETPVKDFKRTLYKLLLKKMQLFLRHLHGKKARVNKYFKDCYVFTNYIVKKMKKKDVKKIQKRHLIKELEKYLQKEDEPQREHDNLKTVDEEGNNISSCYQSEQEEENNEETQFQNYEDEEESAEESGEEEETEGDEEETEDEEEEEEEAEELV